MKNKGIWIVLSIILIAGFGFTRYTQHFISEPVEEVTQEALAETFQLPQVAKSFHMESDSDYSGYLSRLSELDQELEKTHSKERETGSYSAKARMTNELKLWQIELEQILDILETKLPQAECDRLFKEQQEWLRERESRAVTIASKQNSAASEELEYTRLQAQETRSRAYDLARTDGEVLAE